MSIIIIDQRVCVEPQYLNKNIKEYIFGKVKNNIIGKCTYKYGYILEVYRITEITNNIISSVNPDVICNVKVEVKALKPIKGSMLNGVIDVIFQNGIIVIVENILEVLVSDTNLTEKGYSIDIINNTINSDNHSINTGDNIDIILGGVKYSKNKFIVYGEITENRFKQ
jgi:DNA-directed RNA polymerase subunit E'/Rpb7